MEARSGWLSSWQSTVRACGRKQCGRLEQSHCCSLGTRRYTDLSLSTDPIDVSPPPSLCRRQCCLPAANSVTEGAWVNPLQPEGYPQIASSGDTNRPPSRGGARPWQGGTNRKQLRALSPALPQCAHLFQARGVCGVYYVDKPMRLRVIPVFPAGRAVQPAGTRLCRASGPKADPHSWGCAGGKDAAAHSP
eukprot:scaffold1302_cov114-Isochrysis_galbana.AAC.21